MRVHSSKKPATAIRRVHDPKIGNSPLTLTRKMCEVVPRFSSKNQCTTRILARGPAARPRCIPPALALLGIEPIQSHQTYRRLTTHKGAFASPLHPIDLAGVPAPKTPDHFMETASSRAKGVPALVQSRPRRELSRCPSLEPSHRPKVFHALETQTISLRTEVCRCPQAFVPL